MNGLKITSPKSKNFWIFYAPPLQLLSMRFRQLMRESILEKKWLPSSSFLHNHLPQLATAENSVDLTKLKAVVSRLMSDDTHSQFDQDDEITIDESQSETPSRKGTPLETVKNQYDSDDSSITSTTTIQGSEELIPQKRSVEINVDEQVNEVADSFTSSESVSEDECLSVERPASGNGFLVTNMKEEDKMLCALQFLKENISLVQKRNVSFSSRVSTLLQEHNQLLQLADSMVSHVSFAVEAARSDGRKLVNS